MSEGGRLKELVWLVLHSVSKVVMNCLYGRGLCVSGASPYVGALIHSLIRVILYGVDLRVIHIWPVCTDGLIVSLVCRIAMLESSVLGWQFLCGSFLH
jgi:hypothetical protein